MRIHQTATLLPLFALAACADRPEGLIASQPAAVTVEMDFYHRPLPDIPIPNDIATVGDPSSPTGRRVNASMVAPTGMERRARTLIDTLDGWSVFMPISIPFTGPLQVESILAGHRDSDFDFSNDVIYLVNIDRDSDGFGKLVELDMGNGNYPAVLERTEYWKNDPRGGLLSLGFEEVDEDRDGDGELDPGEDANRNGVLDPGEDLNDNGVLDPPEDTDADGVLDRPNYLPGMTPAWDDLAGRADALMTFYERETNTVIMRPMVPLDSRTTYAVVVTRRLLDAEGNPVGSPYPWAHHLAQTEALRPLLEVLPPGVSKDDVAFAYTFTTQTIEDNWVAVRDGLYGHGVQAALADRPPKVERLLPLRDRNNPKFAGKNIFVLSSEEWLEVVPKVLEELQGLDPDSKEYQALQESHAYVDYYAVGWFWSPQLFPREDAEGNWLPYDDQVWPPDISVKPAEVARYEKVYFWAAIPKPEVSKRKDGKPADVVILSHGYGSNRFELAAFGGFFARHGMATVSIDCVSHGISISPTLVELAKGLVEKDGYLPFVEAVFTDRASDQNGDTNTDSGADFWTSYMFHTRDVVRQSALDYMQLVKLLRSFDGTSRAAYTLEGASQAPLAGDFDGDGTVDLGGADAIIGVTGGSLGGIMSTILGALEPEVDVIAPIAGGGGLSDIGLRSIQGGVREAVILRILGPLYVGTLNDGTLKVETIVPDLNDDATVHLADVQGVLPGDTMVVENLVNGERGCGYINAAGTVRTALESDRGDAIALRIYRGPALVTGNDKCQVVAGLEPIAELTSFQVEAEHQATTFAAGAPLVALEDGLGLRRGSPELRRFMSFAQLALDHGDPGVVARHLSKEPLTYPGTGQTSGSHAIIVTTMGDMNVPASSGVSVARSAGFIDYLNPDPRYGKSENQLLLDTHTAEAVNVLGRYSAPEVDPRGVHIDIENFSQGRDPWGEAIPRLDPPLRDGFGETDRLGGVSGAIFPYAVPAGEHGFALPGQMSDWMIDACRRDCNETGEDPCGCSGAATFDVGMFMFDMLGDYFASGGMRVDPDLCHSDGSCPGTPPVPESRPFESLR